HLRREAEPLEDRRRARLRRVAVEPLDRLLEPAEALHVETLVRAGEERLLLDHRLPELRIAHQGHAEDLLVLVEELVLAEHAQAGGLRHRHLARGGLPVAGEDAEERGLAGPVRAHQPVALAGVQLEGDAREEGAVAEALLEVRYGDHGGGNLADHRTGAQEPAVLRRARARAGSTARPRRSRRRSASPASPP